LFQEVLFFKYEMVLAVRSGATDDLYRAVAFVVACKLRSKMQGTDVLKYVCADRLVA
jgi:hypothetical protein